MSRWSIIAALIAVGCSGSPSPGPPVPPPPPPVILSYAKADAAIPRADAAWPPTGVDCEVDAHCTAASYFDPAAEGGCCPHRCKRPVVSLREADRLQRAWEATCSAVRCAPHDCAAFVHPSPSCQAGRCVDRPAR